MKRLVSLILFIAIITTFYTFSSATDNAATGFYTGTQNTDTIPLGHYFLYDKGKKIAYIKDSEITESEAPEGTLSLWSLTEYGLDFCMAFTKNNEIYLVYPDGKKELFADDAVIDYDTAAFSGNRYGITYLTTNGNRKFKRFNGELPDFDIFDYTGTTVISPDGSQFIYVINNNENFIIHTTVPINGKTEFEISEGYPWLMCAFNNGSFYFSIDINHEESIYYIGENGQKEICANSLYYLDAIIDDIYYSSAGDLALVSGNHIIYTLDQEGNLNVISQQLDPQNEYISVADDTLAGNILGNEVELYHTKLTDEENFDTLYFYTYNGDDFDPIDFELYYYENGISRYVLSSDYKPQIYQNTIIYTGKDGTYRGILTGDKIINTKKLSDEKGKPYFGISGKTGYIENGSFIYFVDNGKTEEVCGSEHFSIAKTDSSGEFVYITGSYYSLYNKTDQIFRFERNPAVYSTRANTLTDKTYIQSDYILYDKPAYDKSGLNLYCWTPESSQTTLLENLGWSYGS